VGTQVARILIALLVAAIGVQSVLVPRLGLLPRLVEAHRETEGGEENSQQSKVTELASSEASRRQATERFARTELMPARKGRPAATPLHGRNRRPAEQASRNGMGGPLRC